ncbi:MAG: UvrD-helicase domain-containing protein [Akkermansia sp.]
MASSFSLDSLNEAQRKGVVSIQGPVLILAGAGTGKTRTVTCRISHMVEQGISGRSILAVTFTNKAANEMRERIGQMVERKAARAMMICTFHSLCTRILREDIGRLGYKENFSIYAGNDQVGLLRQLIIRHGGRKEKLEPKDILAEMGRVKNAGRTIADIEDDLIATIAGSYQRELLAQNSVDFDDLLIFAEKILRENKDVREAWRSRFRYITVDEFQDTNSLQMSLLKQLVGPEHNVCVVGDDDQSIYGWRGAQISNILEFEKFFPNPVVIKLEENYRCTAPILNAANALIRHNLGRREKTLNAHKGGGDDVRLVSMPGDAEEAEFIVMDIEGIRRKDSRAWEDFAILFRANTQSRIIEQTLREHKIPYRMVGAQSFYDRKEIKDLVSYLSVLDNPKADVHLLRILNTPKRGISEITSHLTIDWSREHKQSVWEALQDDELLAQFGTAARNHIMAFTEMIGRYMELFKAMARPLDELFEELLVEMDYEAYVCRGCKTENEEQKRLISIGEMKTSLRNFASSGKALTDFLAQINLDQDDDDDDVEKKLGVCLITMHAAKGLEFPIVYLIGLEQGILPHKRSLEDGNCDEERRLLYVGITRAQELLTMTYCATRMRYGDRMPCVRSSFLDEIPNHLLTCESWEELMEKELTPEETADFFASLRSIIIDG